MYKITFFSFTQDPLTHFDADAGADECKLVNSGTTAVKPAIDVWVEPTPEYVEFMNGMHDAVLESTSEVSGEYKAELKRTGIGYSIATLRRYKKQVAPWLASRYTKYTAPMLHKMTLNTEIQPGDTVSVDMIWCKNRHPSNQYNYENIAKKSGSSANCLVKFNEGYKKEDKFTVSCSSPSIPKIDLYGPKDETMGGVDNSICECPVERRVYEKSGQKYVPAQKNRRPTFTQLGNHALGECHRTQSKGGAFNFPKHIQSGCGKTHNIFHSPVMVSGSTQSEVGMMKAIMENGAISVGFKTTPSFKAFKGVGVWDVKPNEKSVGGHAIVLFGWGVDGDSGQKFWWAKNSWGKTPAAIFKFARGKDVVGVESMMASWVSVDPPGTAHSTKLKLSSHPKGFCNDDLLDASLLKDKSKMENSCVKLDCPKTGECMLIFSDACKGAKKTYVDLLTDANYGPIGRNHAQRLKLTAATACIENVRLED